MKGKIEGVDTIKPQHVALNGEKMQKRYLWIVAAIAGIAAGAVLFSSHTKKQALAQFQQAEQEYSLQAYQKVVSLLEKTPQEKLPVEDQLKSLVILAESYQAIENISRAKAIWKEIVEKPEIETVLKDRGQFQLALLSKEETPEKAMDVFRQLAKESENQNVVAGSFFELAKQFQNTKNLIEANNAYREIFSRYPESIFAADAMEQFGANNVQLLFSKKAIPYSKIHVVRPGESLALIAKKYNMPLQLLMESNKLTSANIHPNDRLRVVDARFSIDISKTKNVLILRANDEFVKAYRVGTGREGSTPIGAFKITSKLKEPTWYHPDGGVIPYGDKENLLGTRWMGIDSPGYGIHGTWAPDSVGKQSSAGCVRLRNQDVEELYKIVTVGTTVQITE